MTKCFVVLLGGGSSGKTTARKNVCGEPVEMIREIHNEKPCFVTFYEKYAVAGNHNGGSDANASPELIVESAMKAFSKRDIVFFDGVMGSPRLLDIPNAVDCRVLLVHFDLSQEEVIKRLTLRRKNRGKIEESLPEATLKNSFYFLRRARNTLRQFEERCSKPMFKVTVNDNHTPEEVAQIIKDGIDSCLSMEPGQSFLPKMQSKYSSAVRKIHLSRSSV